MAEKNSPTVVLVKGIEKSFRVYNDKSQTLKERVIHHKRGKYSIHSVLKGIDLDIHKGETVALIGQNGSGKSTLLKLLTGIMTPDSGSISISGKVSSLLELGAGFHPDFSGRENIYNNASIFGLSKKEIDRRYEQIVAFSELEEFIDNPVRTYSSGMYMRLAFSVAINVDADVLLIDEILAVGDANFQKKCMDMIRQLKRKGVTIVMVTHDMGAVERICDRAVWLVDGYIRKAGNPREIIGDYLLNMDEQADQIANIEKARHASIAAPESEQSAQTGASADASAEDEVLADSEVTSHTETEPTEKTGLTEFDETGAKVRWGNGDVVISLVEFYDDKGKNTTILTAGDKLTIRIHFHVCRAVDSLAFGLAVKNTSGAFCIATNSDLRHLTISVPPVGNNTYVDISIPSFDLSKGTYYLDVAAHSIEGFPYDYQVEKYSFLVSNTYSDVGIYAPPMTFSVSPEK